MQQDCLSGGLSLVMTKTDTGTLAQARMLNERGRGERRSSDQQPACSKDAVYVLFILHKGAVDKKEVLNLEFLIHGTRQRAAAVSRA